MKRALLLPTVLLPLIVMLSTSACLADTNWIGSYGGKGGDSAYSVVQTDDGDIIALGRYNGSGSGVWVIKLDSEGMVQWERFYRGIYGYENGEIIETDDGSYAAVVYDEMETTFFILKLGERGDLVWSRRSKEYTTGGRRIRAHAGSIDQTDDCGFIVAGSIEWWNSPTGNKDYLITKLDSRGNVQWARRYGTGDTREWARCVRQTADGGYVVAGEGPILKLDPAGNIEWQKASGSARSILPARDGGYVVSGYLRETSVWKIDPNGDVEWAKEYGSEFDTFRSEIVTTRDGYVVAGARSRASSIDAWLLGLDEQGEVIWERLYGGDSEGTPSWRQKEWFNCIMTSDASRLVAAGFTDEFHGTTERDFLIGSLSSAGLVNRSCPFMDDGEAAAVEVPRIAVSTNATAETVALELVETSVTAKETNLTHNTICRSAAGALTDSGDVNNDHTVDVLDVRLCLQIATGVIEGTAAERDAADVDDDGDVDIDDAKLLAEFIVGMVDSLGGGS